MRTNVLRALACVLPMLLAATESRAWSDRVHEGVAEQSARLMPRSLQAVLSKNLPSLLEGARAASLDEQRLTPEELQDAALAQSQRLLDALTQRASMASVAYEMGVLSRLAALAADPTVAAGGDPREGEWAPDFANFTESRIPKFRLVFSGYSSPALDKDDVRGFVRESLARSGNRYPVLTQMYVQADGTIARSNSFDERHPVYGVASLAYANAISDTAKLWLHAWIRADGDTTELPFPGALPAGVPASAAPARARR